MKKKNGDDFWPVFWIGVVLLVLYVVLPPA